MEKEPIKIETIQQLFEVLTPENTDRFFMDFCVFVHGSIKLKRDFPEIEIKGMTWTDDGESKISGIKWVTKDEEIIFLQTKI